ncbi:MAG: hypothetical protein N2689_14195, partial [Verrucomicrobiae bacterium]|nr:hypothetical protein [Verrucomicrobiae bacterium]
MKRLPFAGWAALLCLPLCPPSPAGVADAIKTIRAVGAEGRGNAEASTAWKELAGNDASQIVPILAGMDGASELAANWLRAAVDAIASRAGNKLPVDDLLA